jgi:hypothetical protein
MCKMRDARYACSIRAQCAQHVFEMQISHYDVHGLSYMVIVVYGTCYMGCKPGYVSGLCMSFSGGWLTDLDDLAKATPLSRLSRVAKSANQTYPTYNPT